MDKQKRKSAILGFILVILILIGDIISAAIGISSSSATSTSCPSSVPSPCWTQIQKGITSCTINAGLSSCVKTITFSPPYSIIPVGDALLNATCGVNCTAAASVTITPPVVPVNAQLVFQASDTTWVNMPAVNTELNSLVDQRLVWTTPSSFTSQLGTFCVSGGSVVGAVSMIVQSSTNQITWTNMGTDGILVSPTTNSLSCVTEAVSLPVSTQMFFRVMGNDAFGPANDKFGTIELYITASFQQATFAVSVACTADLAPPIGSTTSMTVGVTCGNSGITVARTFTIDWWAGIPA